MRFRRAQNPQWQVRLFPPHLRSSTCKLRSGSRPQEIGTQGLFCGARWDKRRLSLFGCKKFSTNAARGFYIPIVMIQNQIEAQCNGFDLERRNSVVSKLSHMRGSERYGACSDDAADTTAELGCSNCCVCLWLFHADRTGERKGSAKPVLPDTGRKSQPSWMRMSGIHRASYVVRRVWTLSTSFRLSYKIRQDPVLIGRAANKKRRKAIIGPFRLLSFGMAVSTVQAGRFRKNNGLMGIVAP